MGGHLPNKKVEERVRDRDRTLLYMYSGLESDGGKCLMANYCTRWRRIFNGLSHSISIKIYRMSLISAWSILLDSTFKSISYRQCITASGSVFHQLLAATRRRIKITKPLTLSACAHFNQPGNFECTRPFQSTRQLCARAPLSVSKTRIQPSPHHMACMVSPSSTCPNSWCTLLPQTKAKGTHTPLHTPGAWWPQCATSGLSVDIWRPPRPSHWSQDQAWLYFSSWIFLAVEKTASERFSRHTPLHTPGAWWPRCAASGLSVDIWRPPRPSHWSQDQAWLYTVLQFLNLPGCGENCIRKFSYFSVRVGAWCTGLPAGLPIKENPGEPGFQSAASDGHRHTPRGHNLNYTIWTLYAESVSPNWAHPFPSTRQTWARPSQVSAPFSSERAPFHQPGKLERALSYLILSYQTVS